MLRLDLGKLDYHLFQIASRASGKKTGIVEIDISDLAIASETKFKLAQASMDLDAAEAAAARAAEAAKAPPPPPPAAEPPKPAEPVISWAETEEENRRDLQARGDAAAAKARLDQYVAEQNLEPSQHNLAVISEWLSKNVRGYFSAAGVDAAIANTRNQLTWKPKVVETPPAPQPQESVEVLGNLPNGEPRLPLDVVPNKSHSAAQLKDYLARVNAGKLIRPRGSFSSRL